MFFEKTIVRKHMIFSGTVTGVGFRYRTKIAAKDLGLTGWVRNTPDDWQVEMEVQGTPRQIDQLIASYKTSPWIEITDIQERTIPVQTGEHGFVVRY